MSRAASSTTRPAKAESPSTATFRAGTGTHAAFEASLEFFLGPVLPLLRDPDVNEVMINGHDRVYVEKAGRIELTAAKFPTEADVQAAANNIAQFVGQPLGTDRPLLDGRLPDGSRVCIVFGTIASGGTHINIRRFGKSTASLDFLLSKKSISAMAMEFLLLAVKGHRNIVVSGGAGSGKTTVVNVLTHGFGEAERIVVIEDTRELQVQRQHVIQLEARPADAYGRGAVSVRDLFITALRMRPDRIVVGEVRRGEAMDMIQAMTSGHHGGMTTVHASSPFDTCYRLETMAMMAELGGGGAIPLHALRRQVASAIDLIVQTARLTSGHRLITGIAEVDFNEETQNYRITDIFRLPVNAQGGAEEAGEGAGRAEIEWTRTRPATLAQLQFEGLTSEMNLTRVML